jgi:polyferredoxin
MPEQMTFNPLILVKFILWIAAIAVAAILLRRRKVSPGVRLAFLVGGILVFGFFFGALIPGGNNPNPVASLRALLTSALVRRQIVPPAAVLLVVLLATVWVSNKSICGWGCQLGLLQGLLHRVRLPKWKPPFWLANSVRILAFVALIGGLLAAGLDWIGVLDPFRIFQFNLTLWVGVFSVVVLASSLFIYRPWCQFLCPFGLVGWLVEQVSLLRPRIDQEACLHCKRCVKACPTQAMADLYAGKRLHADCFACGACIEACPREDALGWRATSRPVRRELAGRQEE